MGLSFSPVVSANSEWFVSGLNKIVQHPVVTCGELVSVENPHIRVTINSIAFLISFKKLFINGL